MDVSQFVDKSTLVIWHHPKWSLLVLLLGLYPSPFGPISGRYGTTPMHYMHLVLPRILDEGYILCSVHYLVEHYGIGSYGVLSGPSSGVSVDPSIGKMEQPVC